MKEQHEMLAWHGAVVANALGVDTTPAELLGEEREETPVFADAESLKAHARELAGGARHGR